jgi:DNA-binding NarL/FixJ family response regulator
MSAYWQTMVRDAFDRRDQHRPADRQTLRAAAVELRARGLTPADIAAALRISEGAVRDLLGEPA